MRDAEHDTAPVEAARFPGELLVWLSASFPVGGFAYSQGLETAAERGWTTDRATLTDWLAAVLRHGALRTDLMVISLIMRAEDRGRVSALCELAAALQPSAERHGEAITQGRGFAQAYEAAWCVGADSPFADLPPITLPAALAIAAREHAIATSPVLEAFAIAQFNNLTSAAIRLGIVGQFDGQRVIADLLPDLRAVCASALTATEDDLGTATLGADLATLLHETQTTRLFRS